MNTNNGVKWRRFIVPNKVEQINDHPFIDTYESNQIEIGENEWRWMIAKCVRDEMDVFNTRRATVVCIEMKSPRWLTERCRCNDSLIDACQFVNSNPDDSRQYVDSSTSMRSAEMKLSSADLVVNRSMICSDLLVYTMAYSMTRCLPSATAHIKRCHVHLISGFI